MREIASTLSNYHIKLEIEKKKERNSPVDRENPKTELKNEWTQVRERERAKQTKKKRRGGEGSECV